MADSTHVIYRGWFNIKMPSYQYRKFHCGDKTIFRPSYLHNGISYTGKTTTLYWIRALVPSHFTRELIEDSCHSGTDGILHIFRLYGGYTNFFVVGQRYFTTGLTCEIRVHTALAICSLLAKWLTRRRWYTGGWFNIKMPSYQYRKSHCGDKTIFRPSYLHNGISYTGKTTSLYWIRALVPLHFTRELIEDSCHSVTDGLWYIGRLYGDYTNLFVRRHPYIESGPWYLSISPGNS